MKKIKVACMISGLLLLAGCAPKQSPLAVINASKSEGLVSVTYRETNIFGGLEKKQPVFTGGIQKATTICQRWNYGHAVELDEDNFEFLCRESDLFAGCMDMQFTKVYQCVSEK